MRISRSAAGLAAAACLVVLTAGCGADQRDTGDRHQPHTRRHRYRSTVSACQHAGHDDGTGHDGAGQPGAVRCHTSQLTAAYTGLNAAMGGSRGMTLILTNHSGSTCYVYGYPGLAFFNGGGFRWPPA